MCEKVFLKVKKKSLYFSLLVLKVVKSYFQFTFFCRITTKSDIQYCFDLRKCLRYSFISISGCNKKFLVTTSSKKLISAAPLGLKCGTHIIKTAYRIMHWKVKHTQQLTFISCLPLINSATVCNDGVCNGYVCKGGRGA